MIRDAKQWTELLREASLLPGSPVKQKDGHWEVTARKDTWKATAARLFDEHLDRFKTLAVKVLREQDPKFELAPDQRFAASLYGKTLKHSHGLRHGMCETLALLATEASALTSCSQGKPEHIAATVVYEALKDADWRLWATLNENLPTLAEASPEAFLAAVEGALGRRPSPFTQVFAQENGGVMGQNYITGLLRALETLAWNPNYLQRITVLLGDLAAIDPGGNWLNRPANSLKDIFLPWHPQTTAPLSKRKAAITALLREQPEVGWTLLASLLPGRQTTTGCRRPVWRAYVPPDWNEAVTNDDYRGQVREYAEMLIEVASRNPKKLTDLLKELPRLPASTHSRILELVTSPSIQSLPDESRAPIWESLTRLAAKHRQFSTADWAMPLEAIAKIEAAATTLEPSSIPLRNRRLFNEQAFQLYMPEGTLDEKETELHIRRQTAIREILKSSGVKGVSSFATQVAFPGIVGDTLGQTESEQSDTAILPHDLLSSDGALRDFARGFTWGRFRAGGWTWVDKIALSGWTQEQKAAFFTALPFGHETWRRAETILQADAALYWKTVDVRPFGPQPHLAEAAEKLLQTGRPFAALSCLNRLIFERVDFPPPIAVESLLAARNSSEQSHIDPYELAEIIKWLQANPTTDREALFKIEWAYLPLLDHDYGGTPKTLESYLANAPSFFAEVIRTVFKSEKATAENKEPTEHEKNVAQQAYRLLHGWRTVPGTDVNGRFNAAAFENWYKEVRRLTTDSGHLRIALDQLGKVLPYAPPDPDGLWIHSTIAEALNDKDAGEMRSGFTCEFFNMRGVHSPTGGREERALAVDFNRKADALEEKGYQRTATAIRGVAESYEKDARREEQRKEHGQ